MNDITVKTFEGTPNLTPDKLQYIRDWYRAAVSLHNSSTAPTLSSFYDGYAASSRDILQLLHEAVEEIAPEAVEAVKKSHSIRKGIVIGILVSGGVVAYKRYQNGVLFPNQKEKRP